MRKLEEDLDSDSLLWQAVIAAEDAGSSLVRAHFAQECDDLAAWTAAHLDRAETALTRAQNLVARARNQIGRR